MLKKIKQLLQKSSTKKILLLPFLILLTGCTDIGYRYSNNWLDKIFVAFRDLGYANVERGNNVMYNLRANAITDAQRNVGQIFDAFNSIKVMPTLITAISILGVAIIVVRFFWLVLRNYLLSFGEDEPPVTFSLIKKTIFSTIFVFIAPYVIINGFMLSTLVGAQVVAYIGANAEEINENTTVAQDLSVTALALETYCFYNDGSKSYSVPDENYNTKLWNLYDQYMSKFYSKDTITINQIYAKMPSNDRFVLSAYFSNSFYRVLYPAGDAKSSGAFMTRLYNKYCAPLPNTGKAPFSVMQAVQENNNLRIASDVYVDDTKITTYESPLLFNGGMGNITNSIFSWLLIMGFALIAFLATATRLGELIISIIATPFFAMQYMTIGDSKSLQTWIQELSSIFLTHVVTVVAFMIGIMEITRDWTATTPLVAGGMIWTLMKGPQIIRNWTNSTGAGGAAGGAARSAVNFMKNI